MNEITIPLDIKSLKIIAQTIDKNGNIIIDVESVNTCSSCHKCGKPATKHNGTAPMRLIRHLPIFDTPVYLRITPVRYSCEDCDDHPTTTEQYDWCDRNATTTKGLEEYLMRCLIHSTIEDVSKKEKISCQIIQTILDRQIKVEVDWEKVHGIETLGIDEIAIKKGYRSYVTVVSAKTQEGSLKIIAILNGRDNELIKSFLESIPLHVKKKIKTVCTDMFDSFVNAAIDVFGVQTLVIDRYHVSQLYRKALDKLRIKETSRLKGELDENDYAELEGMMWILRRDHECLSKADKEKLELLYQYSPLLKKAHRYALKLTHIFNTHSHRKSAMAKMNRWIKSVEKSELACFNKFISTLKKYQPYIANYFKARKNSGFVEGLNNKIKVAKRRCYGLVKVTTIFQRLFLDLQGYECYA
ncbi:MAG: ISL3 family transposase [Bacillota bacterium]|nr:ISL3 family transposase [Bacillota bacterium]